MKNKITFGVVLLISIAIGYRIFWGIEQKHKEREKERREADSLSNLKEENVVLVDSVVESPQEKAIKKLNLTLCEYNSLAVDGSYYHGHESNSFEIAKADEGIIFFNNNSKKVTFNIKDVVVSLEVSVKGGERGYQTFHTVLIQCRKDKELQRISEKILSNEADEKERELYDKTYSDAVIRNCIIEDGANTNSFPLIVYHKDHADKVMKAFTELRNLF